MDSRWLECMKVAMAYYGPDGGDCWVGGPVGLGHLLLEVNPEDTFESQPVRGERGVVVSVARLDNRDALLEMFKITVSEASQITDGHLVSRAFDRWGEELCSHLQGDWALAAWDARERRLLLARDAHGYATLYYYEGQGFIAFASTKKALLALPGVVKEADRLRLAEVLVVWDSDAHLTSYKDIRRLVWARAMSIGPSGRTRTWCHWSADGREPLRYSRDEDYVEAFIEHYTRAVRTCLRTHLPVAAQLSGGRDSGSVVALAAPLLASQGRNLTAYTSVPRFPPDGASNERLGNEWELAHATATMAGANVHHIALDAANYGVIEGAKHYVDVLDEPSHTACNNFWAQEIMEAPLRDGARVILIGQMGNFTVSWPGNGSALLALLQGYPASALRLFLHAEPNPWLTLKRQVLKPFLMPALRAYHRFRMPFRRPWQAYSPINIRLASELDLDGRMRAAGHDPTFTVSPLKDFRRYSFLPEVGVGTSLGAEIAAWHSLAYLDPTANLALTEFLLQVPDEQFCYGRQGSWLFRRALKNQMPGPVLNNQRKGLQGADLGHRIVRELPKFRELLRALDSLPDAREILDMPRLHRYLEAIVAKVDPVTTEGADDMLRGLSVGLFLLGLADSRN